MSQNIKDILHGKLKIKGIKSQFLFFCGKIYSLCKITLTLKKFVSKLSFKQTTGLHFRSSNNVTDTC